MPSAGQYQRTGYRDRRLAKRYCHSISAPMMITMTMECNLEAGTKPERRKDKTQSMADQMNPAAGSCKKKMGNQRRTHTRTHTHFLCPHTGSAVNKKCDARAPVPHRCWGRRREEEEEEEADIIFFLPSCSSAVVIPARF